MDLNPLSLASTAKADIFLHGPALSSLLSLCWSLKVSTNMRSISWPYCLRITSSMKPYLTFQISLMKHMSTFPITRLRSRFARQHERMEYERVVLGVSWDKSAGQPLVSPSSALWVVLACPRHGATALYL